MDVITYKEQNAIIRSTRISNNDFGCLTAFLDLDYGNSGQGFGGYRLYSPKIFQSDEIQLNAAGHFIWRVMEVVGVHTWEELKGQPVRVKTGGYLDAIVAVGNIIKDEWYYPKAEFEQLHAYSKQFLK